jgi:uncharacterized protein (TIGR00255 family)
MIKSMTVFTNSEIQISSLTINYELRSVNHRYCDISFKLPKRLQFLETDLCHAISAEIKLSVFDSKGNSRQHDEVKENIGMRLNSLNF